MKFSDLKVGDFFKDYNSNFPHNKIDNNSYWDAREGRLKKISKDFNVQLLTNKDLQNYAHHKMNIK